jgi:hypothetical protein
MCLRMNGVTKLQELSGWILPDGKWKEVPEWWHLSALFDLRDEGHPDLQCAESKEILSGGDEALIRDLAARKNFAKVSRCLVDAYALSELQLATLQALLECCDLEAELTVLSFGGVQKTLSVARFLKLKRAHHLFATRVEESESNAAEMSRAAQ